MNLLLSLSLFIVVGIFLKASGIVIQIIESWLLLRVQGPTDLTNIIELVGYIMILPISAFLLARLLYKMYFKNSDVSFNLLYFIKGLTIITIASIWFVMTSTESIVSIPFYDFKLPLFLMKFQNFFSKFDYRILAIIGVLFHNIVIALFGSLGINIEMSK